MRKKLNRKLRFALAGFGAFVLAGVSCFGLASLESQDAIASYAIDKPTDGNDITFGNYVFTYNAFNSDYRVRFLQPVVVDGLMLDNITQGSQEMQFFDSNFAMLGSCSGLILIYSDGVLTLDSPTNGMALSFSTSSTGFFAFLDNSNFRFNIHVAIGGSDSTVRLNGTDYTSSHFTATFVVATTYDLEPVLPAPTPVDYVHDIVDILVAGITKLGQGIGQGVSSFVQSLAFNSAGDGLSVYFVLVCVFGGIALAVALTSKIFMWLNGLGA